MRSFPLLMLATALSLSVPVFAQETPATGSPSDTGTATATTDATATDATAAGTTAADAATADATAAAAPLASTQYKAFERGDGMLSLSLGTMIPLGFYDPSGATFLPANSNLGFAFSLSYAGFLNDKWALAGDLSGGFIGTVNDRRLFVAPLSLRAIRVFPLGIFTIAPTAGLGLAITALDNDKHVDALAKFGSSLLWRASTDMSYSLNIFGDVVPQFYADSTQNRVGFFMEATLSVSYHL